MKFKSVLLFTLFMVLCLGEIASAQEISTTKVQLHVPWNLLSERLTSIGESNNSVVEKVIETEQLQVNGISWNLSHLVFDAKLSSDQAHLNETGASIAPSNSTLDIKMDQVGVDQVVERDIDGIKVRIHLKASCGPIALHQSGASAQAAFAFDWSQDVPVVNVTNVDLQWAPGSWSLDSFNCTGVGGLDSLLHDEVLKRLADPEAFRPYLQSFVSSFVKARTLSVIQKIRAPLSVKAGALQLKLSIGKLMPVKTGIVANVAIGRDLTADLDPGTDVPGDSVLNSLPTDTPSLIGTISALEFMVAAQLDAQPDYLTVDLQNVSAFAKLMRSRFLQFFVWQDLWHYPKENPFYLRTANPRKLTLKKESDGRLSTSLKLTSIIQSYRDSKWWSYVVASANGTAAVDLSLSDGVLNYVTSVQPADLTLAYGSEYKAKYKPSGTPPASMIAKALKGGKTAFSGSVTWPELDLGAAGKYNANGLKWIDDQIFYFSLEERKKN